MIGVYTMVLFHIFHHSVIFLYDWCLSHGVISCNTPKCYSTLWLVFTPWCYFTHFTTVLFSSMIGVYPMVLFHVIHHSVIFLYDWCLHHGVISHITPQCYFPLWLVFTPWCHFIYYTTVLFYSMIGVYSMVLFQLLHHGVIYFYDWIHITVQCTLRCRLVSAQPSIPPLKTAAHFHAPLKCKIIHIRPFLSHACFAVNV